MTANEATLICLLFWVSCIGGGFLFTVVVLWTREWMEQRSRERWLSELKRHQ